MPCLVALLVMRYLSCAPDRHLPCVTCNRRRDHPHSQDSALTAMLNGGGMNRPSARPGVCRLTLTAIEGTSTTAWRTSAGGCSVMPVLSVIVLNHAAASFEECHNVRNGNAHPGHSCSPLIGSTVISAATLLTFAAKASEFVLLST